MLQTHEKTWSCHRKKNPNPATFQLPTAQESTKLIPGQLKWIAPTQIRSCRQSNPEHIQKKAEKKKSSATNRKNLGNRQVWVEILAWKWWTSTMWEPCASLEWSKLGTPILTHCCDSWRRYPPWPVLLLACTKLRVRKWARNGPSLLWLSN